MITKFKNSNFYQQSMEEKIFDIIKGFMIAVIIVLVVYPLYFCLIASFSSPNEIYNGNVILMPKGITFEGYLGIFKNKEIWLGYKNSILYTVTGTLCNIAVTIPLAFTLSRKEFPFSGLIMKLLVFTMYFSGGMIPLYFVINKLGLINSMWALILPSMVATYNMIIARAFFISSIPNELSEATFIDGGGYLRFFFAIVLPLSKSLISVMVLFYASIHWNDYFNALMYIRDADKAPLQLILRQILVQSQSAASDSTDVVAMLEKQKIAELIKYGAIIISSVPMLIAYPFVQKYFVKGVMVGAVKG